MVRHVRPADHLAIDPVVAAAFGRRAEAELVAQLRADGDVVFELVEAREGELVGHVMVSRLWADSHGLYAALAPLSVAPSAQRQGIGSALMNAAVETAKEFGVAAMLIRGDPAYYARFGFTPEAAAGVKCPYSGPHLLGRELEPGALAEPLLAAYPKAFG